MAGWPAATLFHCGPGLGNAIANLHSARRAHTPIINIVGDHATYHRPYDAPLTADIEGFARTVSSWVRTSTSASTVGADAAAAVLAAVGAHPGPASRELFDLARPEIRWTKLAEGMGVEAARVETLESFADVFTAARARRGPFLIEFSI